MAVRLIMYEYQLTVVPMEDGHSGVRDTRIQTCHSGLVPILLTETAQFEAALIEPVYRHPPVRSLVCVCVYGNCSGFQICHRCRSLAYGTSRLA